MVACFDEDTDSLLMFCSFLVAFGLNLRTEIFCRLLLSTAWCTDGVVPFDRFVNLTVLTIGDACIMVICYDEAMPRPDSVYS